MKFTSAAAVLALITLGTFTTSGGDWPWWRGADRNGISAEKGWQAQWPATGPKQLWKASVGTGFASFSVSGGCVYTMGNSTNTDWVFCLEAGTGKTVWGQSYPCPLDPKNFEGGPCATPTVADGWVYTFSRKGQLYCFDAAKGTVIWSKDLHGRAVLKSSFRFSDEAHGQVDSTTHPVSEGRIGSITFARLISRPGAIFSLHRPT